MNIVKMLLTAGVMALAGVASAQIWTSNSLSPYALSIASSADGTKLIAACGDFGAALSTNSGTTWTLMPQTVFLAYPSSVACSADGGKFLVYGAGLFVSTNYGATWTRQSNAPSGKLFFASSADGNTLVGGAGSSLYTSTNGGVSWLTNTPPGLPAPNWSSVAGSADGTKWVAGDVNNARIYTSTNSGMTWRTNNVPRGAWSAVASSADGTKLAAASSFGPATGIYTSTNSGTTWQSNNVPDMRWSSIASSADGTRLVVAVGLQHPGGTFIAGPIYSSTNSGISWVSNSAPVAYWSAVASSADGNRLVASRFQNTGIWNSQSTPSPVLNLATVAGSAVFSWIVPSTNVVLEQNADLTTTNWVAVTNVPVLNLTNLQDQLVLPATNNVEFYRLGTP